VKGSIFEKATEPKAKRNGDYTKTKTTTVAIMRRHRTPVEVTQTAYAWLHGFRSRIYGQWRTVTVQNYDVAPFWTLPRRRGTRLNSDAQRTKSYSIATDCDSQPRNWRAYLTALHLLSCWKVRPDAWFEAGDDVVSKNNTSHLRRRLYWVPSRFGSRSSNISMTEILAGKVKRVICYA
jgi:hypothetical protein